MIHPAWLSSWYALAGVLAIGACGTEPELQAPGIILYGKALSTPSTGIPGAVVTISHHPGTCGSGAAEQIPVMADATGKYRLELRIVSSADGCVRIRFAAAGFAADSATLTGLTYRSQEPLDSVETNKVLAPQ